MTDEEIENLYRQKLAEWEQISDPAEQWRLFQEFIAWADAQRPVPRNSREGCLAAQRKLLERYAQREKAD